MIMWTKHNKAETVQVSPDKNRDLNNTTILKKDKMPVTKIIYSSLSKMETEQNRIK